MEGTTMTQEYTPTDQQVIDDYMPDEEDIGFDARTMSIGEWKRLKIAAFNRWIAAHDAQIREEALSHADDSTSDGYHTFAELYQYRMLYNAWAIRAWLQAGYTVVKSHRHSDGELCFGGKNFVVHAELPTGQVSNHYADDYWDLFDCPAVEQEPDYDGHTPQIAATRIEEALAPIIPSNESEISASVPRVRAVEPDGTVSAEGFYFRHVNRQPSPIGDSLKPEDIDECIVTDGSADWELEPPVRLLKVTLPTRIEVIEGRKQ
jgi:hypothetical protein